MTTFEERQARVTEIQAAIQDGSINSASSSTLAKYTAWLSESVIQGSFSGQNYLQVCETVRLQMLRAMLEAIEDRSKSMQRWVIALAVAALLTSILQAVASIRAEMRASVETAAPPQTAAAIPQPVNRVTPSATPASSLVPQLPASAAK